MTEIGQDVIRRLKIVPAKFVVVETHIHRYASVQVSDLGSEKCSETGYERSGAGGYIVTDERTGRVPGGWQDYVSELTLTFVLLPVYLN